MKFDQTKHLNSEYEENLSSNNSDESKKEDSVIYLSEQSARKKTINALEGGHAQTFEMSLRRLKNFSKNIPEKAKLPTMKTSAGWFDWFDYKVTGEDVNKLTENIQQKMIDQNKIMGHVIKEFEEVYQTFDALDKDYIQKILIAIEAAKFADDKAVESLEKIENQQDEILGSQQDISNIITQQETMIRILTKFRKELQKLNHLNEVDDMYAINQQAVADINGLEQKYEILLEQIKRTDHMVNQTKNDLQESILKLQQIVNEKSNEIDNVLKQQVIKEMNLNTRLDEQVENISKIDKKSQSTTTFLLDKIKKYELENNHETQILKFRLSKINRVLVLLIITMFVLVVAFVWITLKGLY